MTRINSAAELEDRRQIILSKRDGEKPSIAICGGTSCLALDNDRIVSAFEDEIAGQSLENRIHVRVTGCLGFCQKGPIVVIYPEEICYTEVKPGDVPEIVSQTVAESTVDIL